MQIELTKTFRHGRLHYSFNLIYNSETRRVNTNGSPFFRFKAHLLFWRAGNLTLNEKEQIIFLSNISSKRP